MSVTGKRGVGVPVILMHDGEGTIVTVECKNGDTYRGFLDETEDNMNCILKDATRTDAKGNKPSTRRLDGVELPAVDAQRERGHHGRTLASSRARRARGPGRSYLDL